MIGALAAAALWTAAAFGVTPAQAEDGFYGTAKVGLAWFDLRSDSDDVDTDTGLTAHGAAGYAYGDVRLEFEAGYYQADLDEDQFDGDVEAFSGLVNGYYDLPTGTNVEPYVGGGVGVARIGIEDDTRDDDEVVFAWNAVAGVNYSFDGRMTFSAQYRYLDLQDATLDGAEFESKVHALQIGASLPF